MRPLTDKDGEVRELTADDMAQFKPASDVLPASLFSKLNRVGRPTADNPKVLTSVRFDPDVLAAFKATGRGWQTRMNNALKEWLQTTAK